MCVRLSSVCVRRTVENLVVVDAMAALLLPHDAGIHLDFMTGKFLGMCRKLLGTGKFWGMCKFQGMCKFLGMCGNALGTGAFISPRKDDDLHCSQSCVAGLSFVGGTM